MRNKVPYFSELTTERKQAQDDTISKVRVKMKNLFEATARDIMVDMSHVWERFLPFRSLTLDREFHLVLWACQ